MAAAVCVGFLLFGCFGLLKGREGPFKGGLERFKAIKHYRKINRKLFSLMLKIIETQLHYVL